MTTLETILDALSGLVKEGRTGNDLEQYAELLMQTHKVEPAFKGYHPEGFPGPYPAILCVSINGEVIHGIPDERKFEDGDVVKIDCGTKDENGQYDDGAITIIVGRGSAAARRLIKATQAALEAGVAAAKPGNTTNDIGAAIAAVAKEYEVAVVHGYGGHGIGTELHMEPFIPNEVTYHNESKDSAGVDKVPDVWPVMLTKGMRIAIEPMFATKLGYTEIAKNGWTIKLVGGGVAAHFERTVTV